MPIYTYEHIDRATETLSKITLWATRTQYKLRTFLKKRVEITDKQTKNELLIRMFIELLH
jgi:hypothetical protein